MHRCGRRPFVLLATPAFLLAAAGAGAEARCVERPALDPAALRIVVVGAGEEDPAVARQIATLGANALATSSPPRPETAFAAASAGLAYIPRLSTREIERLLVDTPRTESIRRMSGIAGIHYLDDSVEEGYTSPETQARAYGILKSLFPDRLALYATRLDPVATDPGYLAAYYRPEFTDLVTPYFYPVGTTVLGTHRESDRWEDTLRSLLDPLAAATPRGKPILPVLQAFEQTGHPVGGSLLRRQLGVYAELWPGNRNVAAFWWGGPTTEPFAGIADLPALARGVRELFGTDPSRPAPCVAAPRLPLESAP